MLKNKIITGFLVFTVFFLFMVVTVDYLTIKDWQQHYQQSIDNLAENNLIDQRAKNLLFKEDVYTLSLETIVKKYGTIMAGYMLILTLTGYILIRYLKPLARTLEKISELTRKYNNGKELIKGDELTTLDKNITFLSSYINNYLEENKKEKRRVAEYQIQLENKFFDSVKHYEEEKDVSYKLRSQKELFLQKMSFDIRTPVDAITGIASLLNNTNLDTSQKEYVKYIEESSDNLLQVINNIIDYIKIEDNKIEIENIPFDLNKLLSESTDLLFAKAKDKNISLSINYTPRVPKVVRGDNERITQIIFNIVDNIIDNIKGGNIEIKVTIAGAVNGKMIFKISFLVNNLEYNSNTFINMEKYFNKVLNGQCNIDKLDNSLGLAICCELINIMGGEIGFNKINQENQLDGQEEVFWFSLPMESISEGEFSYDNETLKKDFNVSNVHVLLVEDQPINQMVIKKLLENIGCIVTPASDGASAVRLYSEGEMKFDLVVMDCKLPEKNGYQASVEIRDYEKDSDLVKVPIIALTAYALSGDKQKCFNAGMDDYITKPVSKNKLYNVILKHLNEDKISYINSVSRQKIA